LEQNTAVFAAHGFMVPHQWHASFTTLIFSPSALGKGSDHTQGTCHTFFVLVNVTPHAQHAGALIGDSTPH